MITGLTPVAARLCIGMAFVLPIDERKMWLWKSFL